MTVIQKMLEATNVIKSRALKNIPVVPLIAHMHAWAERADAGTKEVQADCAPGLPEQ